MSDKRFILAITGPAGSGKSTVAGKLAKQHNKCVNIDADLVKHFIVNGFLYDTTPAGITQWELLGDNIGILANNFFNSGYSVIINGYINEPAWQKINEHIALSHKVLLLPNPDTATARDAGRAEEARMGDVAIKEHHAYFSNSSFFNDFTKLDTTEHTVDETVNKIVSIIYG